MKKKNFNALDVLIIIVLIACAAGIAVRAFGLSRIKTDEPSPYRVLFTAQLTAEEAARISSGIKFRDENGTEGELLEGYWIKNNANGAELYGELLVNGRMNGAGFEANGHSYFINDVLQLRSGDLKFSATVSDIAER
ncbi:MAG: hypothetical protein J5879_01205 [Clostridia bacterium]|nr:hypothetical protein [Clostridia bacterium]